MTRKRIDGGQVARIVARADGQIWLFGATVALAIVLLMPTGARAQQRTIYGADGHVVGLTHTDSGGLTTIYGADGRVVGRASTGNGGSTTIYGAEGHVVGRTHTDSGGTTTMYGADGRVTGRSFTTGNITTIYGADGRKARSFTTQ